MSQIASIYADLDKSWNELVSARPDERFDSLPELLADHLTQAIGNLGSVVKTLEEKGLFNSSPELAIALPIIVARLRNATDAVKGAQGRGFNWLANGSFFEDLASAQSMIAALTAKRISLTREIAKDLTKKGLSEIERVVAARKAAEFVISAKQQSEEGLAGVIASVDKAKIASDAVRTLSTDAESGIAEIRRLEVESKASAQAAADANAKTQGTAQAITQLKDEAEKREAELQERIRQSNAQVAALREEAEAAKKTVKEALRLARDQGLARSFQSRSDNLREERRLWTIVFVGAVAVLATLSAVLVADLSDLTYQGLIVAVLRKLALAAPAVWLGWYSARQIGRVARVQEDYEYKAASALAYQSYKDEAALGADPSLMTELLKHAIVTFGENPVRLYADGATDPVTPVESLLKKVPTNKIVAVAAGVIAAAEQAKKT